MELRLQHLFRRYLDNTCTQEELEEFFGYVHKSEHDESLRQLIKKVYDEMATDHSTVPHVDEHGRLVLSETADQPVRLGLKNHRTVKASAKYLVAALLIIITATFFVVHVMHRQENKATALASLTKKATNRSESKFILLEDSTQVWLNAASSLEFPDQFDETKREVFLSGEAYFDVMHADKVPFIIHTGNISTTVLGTAFNIKAYPGEKNITIAVSRGKVKVTRQDGWEVTLTKGQQVKLHENGQEAINKNIPGETIAGWQQGLISYDDEPLRDIIADMERVYNVSISISDPSIADLGISTSFKKEIGIEQALQVLCKLTDAELKKTGDGFLIQ
jgi:ferric-dicitrate binding protein FerR (iron transport regulator)